MELPWPPSVNHYWGHRVVGKRVITYVNAKGKQFREDVKKICKVNLAHAQEHFFNAQMNRLAVYINIYPPDKRRRDVDNLNKAILDALQEAGMYEDDSQIDHLVCSRNINDTREGGLIKIAIVQIEETDKYDNYVQSDI